MMEPFCYLNGNILPVAEAKVGVYDIGLLRGFGIYEALRTFARKPFMLAEHLKRLHASAEAMRLSIPETDARIAGILNELIEKNVTRQREALARFILTGGEALGGLEHDPKKQPTFYILVEPLEELAPEVFARGCSVILAEHERPFAQSKTTNYIQAVLLQPERRRAGALEILYTFQDRVLECATSNFFIVKKGVVVTPKSGVLFGITRNAVVDIARKAFPTEERDLSLDEVFAADEAFLTSSFKDVVPVVQVGNKKIGSGAPGPITQKIMQLFQEFAQRT